MINLARFFSYTRKIEEDLERERQAHARTHAEARKDRERLTDAFARARGATSVYAPLPPPEHPMIGKPAVGPTMTRARASAEQLNRERHKRQPTEAEIAEAARLAIEDVVEAAAPDRSNGEAEWPQPIAPDKVI